VVVGGNKLTGKFKGGSETKPPGCFKFRGNTVLLQGGEGGFTVKSEGGLTAKSKLSKKGGEERTPFLPSFTSSTLRLKILIPTLRLKTFLLFVVCLAVVFAGCELGTGPGDGKKDIPSIDVPNVPEVPDVPNARSVLEMMAGVWYSHSGGVRTDGYRIGKWKDRHELLPQAKRDLFPGFDIDAPGFRNYNGVAYNAANDFSEGLDEEYFVFFDDTVFGQSDDGSGGNGGWSDDIRYRYIGIVKAVNIFNAADGSAGAVIIHYLNDCYPTWDSDFLKPPPKSFFGIYYRILGRDSIQLANAVELANIDTGKYYTETATLREAIDKNTAENEKAFISWGVVLPQDREQ
jgi:hypothetical protein